MIYFDSFKSTFFARSLSLSQFSPMASRLVVVVGGGGVHDLLYCFFVVVFMIIFLLIALPWSVGVHSFVCAQFDCDDFA